MAVNAAGRLWQLVERLLASPRHGEHGAALARPGSLRRLNGYSNDRPLDLALSRLGYPGDQ